MKRISAFTISWVCVAPIIARAQVASVSTTGNLASPRSVAPVTFALTAADTVTFQTWGFGGGVNAAGTSIPAGGFDPLIVLYAGPVASASAFVDGSGNVLANADNLVNPPWSNVGNCPAAGTVHIGANNDCGDVKMQVALPAGTYTLLLTDANYLPDAVFDKGGISEGYWDLTGGVFQTCDPVANACVSRNGNYALDISSSKSVLLAVSKCDVNQDLSTNISDVQLMLKQALGGNSFNNDLDGSGKLDVTDIQIVIDAARSLGCEAK